MFEIDLKLLITFEKLSEQFDKVWKHLKIHGERLKQVLWSPIKFEKGRNSSKIIK